ncbi:Predicted transcriptional regulator, contains HTH domain [Halobiforma haloterrestris]|uniref:Predicted transcriptional regulator, contains HTH domain n=1 Tax=Natronobacterium haloterrestre TaxID=148448 RepID=A0A1I1DJ48_NATHA|nr:helix-turn-helix domain-containing protein [Halobiforma haloterrestris]SFB74466.1 Predicted transcriptional regulator, contains HTH domain [Halobiforma haloterrestris]
MLAAADRLSETLQKRYRCLQALVEQARTKRELVDALEIPRSTLDDIVRELESDGLVEYRDGRWQPTYSGRLAYRAHQEYRGRLASLTELSPVLDELDSGTELSLVFVDGANVHRSQPEIPDSVLSTLVECVGAATHVRAVAPKLIAGHVERLYQQSTTGDSATFDIVVPETVYEEFQSAYPSITTTLREDKDVHVHHALIPFSFDIWICDDERAAVSVFTDRGIAGILVNDTADAVEWADRQYRRVLGGH